MVRCVVSHPDGQHATSPSHKLQRYAVVIHPLALALADAGSAGSAGVTHLGQGIRWLPPADTPSNRVPITLPRNHTGGGRGLAWFRLAKQAQGSRRVKAA